MKTLASYPFNIERIQHTCEFPDETVVWHSRTRKYDMANLKIFPLILDVHFEFSRKTGSEFRLLYFLS